MRLVQQHASALAVSRSSTREQHPRAAAARGAPSAPDVRVVKLTASSPATGIDWADAGVGAAGLLGVILVALSTLAVVHRRHGGPARRRAAPSG